METQSVMPIRLPRDGVTRDGPQDFITTSPYCFQVTQIVSLIGATKEERR